MKLVKVLKAVTKTSSDFIYCHISLNFTEENNLKAAKVGH